MIAAVVASDLVHTLHRLLGPALDPARLLRDLLAVVSAPGIDRSHEVESIVRRHLRTVSSATLVHSAQAGRLMQYINDHLHEPITIARLTTVMGCSRSQLVALLHARAGLSLREYVTRLRVQKAVEMLLRREKASVAMVEVGYHNKTCFNRAFKRFTGVVPRDFIMSPQRAAGLQSMTRWTRNSQSQS